MLRSSPAVLSLLLLSACAHSPEPAPAPVAASEATTPASETPRASQGEASSTSVPQSWIWVDASAADLRFAMPKAPQIENSEDETDAGLAKTTTWSVEIDDQYLAVSMTQFPEGTISQSLPVDVLVGARDGSRANVNGTLTSDRAILVKGPPGSAKKMLPGRDYRMTLPQGLLASSRVFVLEDRLYQVIYVRTEPDETVFTHLAGSLRFQ